MYRIRPGGMTVSVIDGEVLVGMTGGEVLYAAACEVSVTAQIRFSVWRGW